LRINEHINFYIYIYIHLFTQSGGECALRSGAAKARDHNLMVHAVWLMAARGGYGLWVERVPTKENLADLPSREEYALLQQMGSVKATPQLDKAFWQPDKWETVALHTGQL
jgi:hypothetical protein